MGESDDREEGRGSGDREEGQERVVIGKRVGESGDREEGWGRVVIGKKGGRG